MPNAFKIKIRLPDGRMKKCGTGTSDPATYAAMRGWVQALKRADRLDVLEAIVLRNVPFPDAFRLRTSPDGVLALSGARDIEPFITPWHAEKAASRKGASSADDYLRQVREMIPAGATFPTARFTSQFIRQWLRGLKVQDPTRNRYKAAISSFAAYLVEESVIERNPVFDVRGFSEGQGRMQFYDVEDAKRLAERIPEAEKRAAFVLAATAGLERQVLERLRVRDVDLVKKTIWADGGKTAWRRRQVKLLWEWGWKAVEQATKAKLPDALLLPSVVNDDHVMLLAIEKAAGALQLPVLTLHDQRHTLAVNALRAGYKPTVVSHQLGHRDTSLVWKRYGRFVVEERDYQLPAAQTAGLEIAK